MAKFKFFILLIATISIMGACTNDDDNQVSSNTPQGLWKVTWYFDKDKDETNDFASYTFEFLDDGTFVGNLPDGSIKLGTWTQTSSKLVIDINGTQPLDKLNDDWLILEKNDVIIRLKDDNNTHLEELTFEKT
ncbi:MAG: hypothetical protein D6816_12230 [Bacteroidetes bacterium]|nr:MAG: hypothetical protein D6816_12230 [Bacteroidota bacterium]